MNTDSLSQTIPDMESVCEASAPLWNSTTAYMPFLSKTESLFCECLFKFNAILSRFTNAQFFLIRYGILSNSHSTLYLMALLMQRNVWENVNAEETNRAQLFLGSA